MSILNDIFTTIEHSRITLFADDCVLYYSANTWNHISEILQLDLNNATVWFNNNGLSLNTSKTKTLIIGSRAKLSNIKEPRKFASNQCQIDFVKQYDYLGTILDSEMSLLPLFKKTIKITYKIFLLRKIRKYIDNHTALCIYKLY